MLELETIEGSLRLAVDRGRVSLPSKEELAEAGRVLACCEGRFRFLPGDIKPVEGDSISLSAFAEAASGAVSDDALDRLLEEELVESASSSAPIKINILPAQPLENPLDDLMTDLEIGPLEDLLAAHIVILAQDPHWWRSGIERFWQQKGWTVRYAAPSECDDLSKVDVLVVHHQTSAGWMGMEEDWIDLVRRAAGEEPAVPVVWVSPLGDPAWVHRLVEAGVSFLLPAPQAVVGEAMHGFAESVSAVVERQLLNRPLSEALPSGVADLVGALLSESDPVQGVTSLLHLAAEHFSRGAVLLADESSIRCRAGFGFPLDKDHTTLPRGDDLLERVIVGGEAITEFETETAAGELAAVLGVPSLANETAIIPLGRTGAVAGFLVADRDGKPLPDLTDLVRLAGRLGGAFVC
jgi:DNA-binding NarL/FixJ family response regulator